jgi:hypothetical protein
MMLLMFSFLVLVISCFTTRIVKEAEAPEFQSGSLSEAGIDSLLINRIDSQIVKQVYPNIHSVLIVRNNKLVYEKYYAGTD